MNDGRHVTSLPAEDRDVGGRSWGTGCLASFPPNNAISLLAQAGVNLTKSDAIMLAAAVRTFHGFSSLQFTIRSTDRERRLRAACTQLLEILNETEDSEDPLRVVWGGADWSDFDITLEPPEPEHTIDISEFGRDLQILRDSADERLAWLESHSEFHLEPKSNRVIRERYFYWLILLGFWRYQLHKTIATSTGSNRGSYGPLIRFIQIMSSGEMKPDELRGTTIRAFVRRFGKRAEWFKSWFD